MRVKKKIKHSRFFLLLLMSHTTANTRMNMVYQALEELKFWDLVRKYDRNEDLAQIFPIPDREQIHLINSLLRIRRVFHFHQDNLHKQSSERVERIVETYRQYMKDLMQFFAKEQGYKLKKNKSGNYQFVPLARVKVCTENNENQVISPRKNVHKPEKKRHAKHFTSTSFSTEPPTVIHRPAPPRSSVSPVKLNTDVLSPRQKKELERMMDETQDESPRNEIQDETQDENQDATTPSRHVTNRSSGLPSVPSLPFILGDPFQFFSFRAMYPPNDTIIPIKPVHDSIVIEEAENESDESDETVPRQSLRSSPLSSPRSSPRQSPDKSLEETNRSQSTETNSQRDQQQNQHAPSVVNHVDKQSPSPPQSPLHTATTSQPTLTEPDSIDTDDVVLP